MNAILSLLSDRADKESMPLDVIVRRHLLHGVLRRWAHSSQANALVLRGGLVTQLWVGPHRRTTNDIDFLALFPRDLDDMKRRLEAILSMPSDDEVSFDLSSLQGTVIWQETEFAGLRFVLSCAAADRAMPLQIDIGFGDPLVPPVEWIDYPTFIGSVRIQAVRPELLVAWKLDGLFDRRAKRWQAKDLFDLLLLTSHCQLDVDVLTESIRVAFLAHNDPLEAIPDILYSRSWWETDRARERWSKFCAQSIVPVPDRLREVAESVAHALRPALSPLVPLPES